MNTGGTTKMSAFLCYRAGATVATKEENLVIFN